MIYSTKHDNWSISSAEWESAEGTRLDSRQKPINLARIEEIEEDLISELQDKLNIEVDGFRGYLQQ